MDHDAARDESLVLHFDVPRHQRATRDHRIVADGAVMRDVAGSHDVIAVADGGDGFGLRAARNRVVFADLVAGADAQIAAFAVEILVQRIGAQHGAGRNLVAVAERGPAFHEDVGFEQAIGADGDILFDDAEFADAACARR